ncbi:hypothetical protein GCM10027343_33870 [Noviherbaspirillum agri]
MRTFLTGLALASLLPGLLGAGVLFVYEYRQGRAQLEQNTILTARALMQAVDNHLLQAQSVAQVLSTADSLSVGDFATFHARARAAIAKAELGVNAVLRDERGRQILNTAVDYGEPLPPDPVPDQVRMVFETAEPTVSDIFIGPMLKQPVVSVDVPVMIDGKVAYALGVGILPEHFNTLLRLQGLPHDWVVGVFDSAGNIVSRTHSTEKFIGKKASAGLHQSMMSSPEGSLTTTTGEGIEVLSFHTRSPLTNWKVAIGIPRQIIEAAFLQTMSMLALGVAALFVVGILLSRYMGRKVAYSVSALTASASALGKGETTTAPQVYVKEAEAVASAIVRASELLKEREAALRTRADELLEAHRLAKFGTWHWDMDSGAVETSDSVREIYGRDVPSFPEQRGTLLPVDSWERVNAALQETLATGRGYDLELEVNHGAGHTVWVNAKCEAIRDSTGRVTALRGTVMDITERKRAELQMRESEQRFRLLADNVAQLAWMADGEGSIFWYNRRWFEYTGTTLDEMRGWGWTKMHHPEHVERVVAKISDCFSSGKRWEDCFPLRGADGRYRWFLSRAVPERDSAGRVVRWFGTNTDITAQRETEDELRKFKFFSDNANDGNLVIDRNGRIRYANKLLCERLGYSEAELLQMGVPDIDPLYPLERFQQSFDRSKNSRMQPFEGVHRRKDGSTFPVEISSAVLELNGEWLMFATSRDITERKQTEQRVREAALHDALTGLPNRALVFEYCGHMLAAARRNHGRGALLFIDLDRFKPVNDLYGHETGDRLLQEVARRLGACTRSEDLVGRLGGDEFVVILPHLDTGRHRAATVAQHIVEAISRPFRIDSLELSVSPSIGISIFPEHATEVGALIHAADLAMYQAKQSGRANYQFYTTELEERADQALTLELRLKHALRHNGLKLHYQPVVDIKTGRLIGAEALVRLADGSGEPVGPDRFIPVAESAGLISELGEWVAAEACRQHEQWQREGLELTIAINVSPLQFRHAAFADKLSGIITDAGIDPSRLEIEVTESAVMENIDDAVAILNRIKSLGVKVALDDFGTGYSSLSSLSSLPLDKLKVDQSFVRRIERDQASRAVTEAIIALGRSLKLNVVGEGIESENALRYLEEQGCNQAQGYWFSQPLPPAEFAAWCRQRWGRNRELAVGQA